jgi:transposase
LTSLLTSYATEVGLGVVEVLGVERRRRWPDTVKLSILAEVNVNGWTLADVARRHDLTRQHIYQWRREMRTRGLWPSGDAAPKFLLAEFTPSSSNGSATPSNGDTSDITIVLHGGRQLRCRDAIAETILVRLVRAIEAA